MKYVIQKAISLLPLDMGLRANRFLQTRFGGLRRQIIYGLPRTLTMVWALERVGVQVSGKTFLEVGTGWDGSSALTLLSLGAARVESLDVVRHLDPVLHQKAARLIAERCGFQEEQDLPFAPDYHELIGRCDLSIVQQDRFIYRAPADASATALPSGSIDVWYSLAVLEHVPEPELRAMLAESYRVLTPGGFCYHYIQPTMHAASFDETALAVDYLRVSEFAWKAFFANSISYENRLRGIDYVRMLEEAGFRVLKCWHTIDSASLEALPRLRLDAKFAGYSAEELATNFLWIVAQKPGSAI